MAIDKLNYKFLINVGIAYQALTAKIIGIFFDRIIAPIMNPNTLFSEKKT
tara:strand:+ start:1811 stop:1960 length:150 start_codon:yes stop_codon:yes gene_type:complete